jgi:type I restriction enzyme S subunit
MKPYSSYKDSGIAWIGQIPSHWKTERAKNIFYREARSVRDSDEVITCFRDGQVTLRKNRRTEGFTESLKEIGYQGIRKGDLVIHQMDAFAGSIGISDSDGKGTPVYICCNPKDSTVANNSYFCHVLREMAKTGFIKSLYRGIRERSSDFRFETFAVQNIPIPPIAEQEAIVRFITEKSEKIDRYIAEQERMVTALNELRAAEIARAVTRGLNPDAPLRDSGIDWIGSIPAHWELLRLKNCGSIYSGLSGKSGKDFEIDEDDNDFALFVPFTNIFNNSRIRKDKMAKVKVQPNEQQNEVLNGDLLFLMSSEDFNGIGKCSLYALEMNTPVYLNSFCKGFRVTNPKVTPAYLCYLMNTPACKTYIDNNSHGFIRINLRQDILTACPIILPPLDEQRAIVEYLDAKTAKIDRMKADIEKQIGLLKEYKQRMISDAVTGKIDVRE